MTRCTKCGAEIRYIPCKPSQSPSGVFIVSAESIEVITDSGRIVQGYLRHECPKGDEAGTIDGAK